MNLSTQVVQLNHSISKTINSLIDSIGITSNNNASEKMLDLRAFSLNKGQETPYRIEVLVNRYKVEYITASKAYCERGMQYDLFSVTDTHLTELCEALDALSKNGYPRYNVVLRAIVHVDINDLGEDFIFPEEWEQTDRTGDTDLVIRLDTVMEVSASNKEDAIEKAKDEPVSLGLDGICCDIEHWVDEEQDDDVQLIT